MNPTSRAEIGRFSGQTEDSGTVKSTIRSTVDSTAPKLTED
ncbi:MAG TPA: hypothetical protein VHX59_25330 [Mycobacteriales bacterium]|jgi:hypothetical protein|nr:hypothetical protein [Mycobacteriales bacterium]